MTFKAQGAPPVAPHKHGRQSGVEIMTGAASELPVKQSDPPVEQFLPSISAFSCCLLIISTYGMTAGIPGAMLPDAAADINHARPGKSAIMATEAFLRFTIQRLTGVYRLVLWLMEQRRDNLMTVLIFFEKRFPMTAHAEGLSRFLCHQQIFSAPVNFMAGRAGHFSRPVQLEFRRQREGRFHPVRMRHDGSNLRMTSLAKLVHIADEQYLPTLQGRVEMALAALALEEVFFLHVFCKSKQCRKRPTK
jgi:hypothetical protein